MPRRRKTPEVEPMPDAPEAPIERPDADAPLDTQLDSLARQIAHEAAGSASAEFRLDAFKALTTHFAAMTKLNKKPNDDEGCTNFGELRRRVRASDEAAGTA